MPIRTMAAFVHVLQQGCLVCFESFLQAVRLSVAEPAQWAHLPQSTVGTSATKHNSVNVLNDCIRTTVYQPNLCHMVSLLLPPVRGRIDGQVACCGASMMCRVINHRKNRKVFAVEQSNRSVCTQRQPTAMLQSTLPH